MFNTMSKMAQVSGQADVLSVGVDAYTCIFRGSSSVDKAMALVDKFVLSMNLDQQKKSIYSNHGYSGVSYGLFYFGVKGQNVIIGATGQASVEVEEACRQYFPNVTRIDLQVTVNLPFADELFIEEVFKEQKKLAKVKKSWPMVSMVSSETGETLYVGKRGSGIVLRLYDKGYEYGVDPGLLIRFEVEYRDDTAENIAHALGSTGDVRDQIARQVFHSYYQRCIRVPIEYGEKVDTVNIPRNGASHQAYLDWARRVIGPTMVKLQGFEEGQELMKELGIQTTFLNSLNLPETDKPV